ncbi:MAG: DUF1553 domain-containing protein [Planctomycetota bacterium]|nr:DUF1553 domain-containing protein [Planctomycetota bacterium]
MRLAFIATIAGLAISVPSAMTRAQPTDAPKADPAKAAFFEKMVRPLLVKRCVDCHNGDEQESQLRLDSLAGMLRGGLRGPAIVRGNAEASLLVRAVRHGELLKMPAKRKLPPDEIATLVKWVADGAVWPNSEPVENVRPRDDPKSVQFSDVQKSFWAFQAPRQSSPPQVKDTEWLRSPIDAFVLSRLENAGLPPAARADKRTLIRRATFDLIGLPPTPRELDEFLADDSPDAFARLVDRLLASPHYGQRWGRHWLDVVRYADSNGLDENLAYANAYHYRDYVIEAFNANKRFDRFVQEQLAGDRLPDDGTPNNNLDRITATGLLCIGPKMLAEDDPVKMRMDIIDEQIDTIGRAFMGLTLGCARCHDHKFDPIPTDDYYSLVGIFHSTTTMDTFSVVAKWHERPLATPESVAARERVLQRIKGLQGEAASARDAAAATLIDEARRHVGDYLLAAESNRRRDIALAKLKPIGPQLKDAKARADVIFREAENYDRGNVTKDFTSYGAGIGVLVNAGKLPNFAEYDVTVPADGTYRLEVRYAAEAARPCTLVVNGIVIRADIADGVTGSWQPDSQRWEIEGFVTLKAGKNVVRLEHAQYFPHIDKLLFAKSSEAELPTIAPLDAKYVPVPEFVRAWQTHLDNAAKEKSSVFQQLVKASAVPDGKPKTSELRAIAERFQATVNPSLANDPAPKDSQVSQTDFTALVQNPNGPFKFQDTVAQRFPKPVTERLAELKKREQEATKSMPSMPMVMAVEDGTVKDVRVHHRGSHLTQGSIVPRRFLQIMAGTQQPPIPNTRSGRRDLADWLTSDSHPLTARVFVNRVWHWHFGQGLVRSNDNFGRLGERPTHPELLDWLAVRFVQSGWDIKDLHRLILLSSTWQMSTQFSEHAAAKDPENRLCWRMNRRRLEAEAMRDSIHVVAQQLDQHMGGTMLPTANRKYVTSTANVDPVAYVTNRRSVYMPVVRSALYDVFQAFDFADPSVINGQRQVTTVAPQALFMMNSEVVSRLTRIMASTLLAVQGLSDKSRVVEIYRRAYSRQPTTTEVDRAIGFVQVYEQRWAAARPDEAQDAKTRAWQGLCRIILAGNEFVYLE